MATQQTFFFLESDSTGQTDSRVTDPSGSVDHVAAAFETNLTSDVESTLESTAALLAGSLADSEPGLNRSLCPDQSLCPDHLRAETLRRLRRVTSSIHSHSGDEAPVLSTGTPALDRLLPRRGLRTDALVECVESGGGSGATSLAMIMAANHLTGHLNRTTGSQPGSDGVKNASETEHASQTFRVATGPLVVVDLSGTFYPPAAVALGIPAERIVWCTPENHADLIWTIDQSLRCQSVAAVLAYVGDRLDDRDARRLQLAAETGKTLGMFVRPSTVRGKPSFAETRLFVRPIDSTGITGATIICRDTRQRVKADFEDNASDGRSSDPTRRTPLSRGESVLTSIRVTVDRTRGGVTGKSTEIAVTDRGKLYELRLNDFGSRGQTADRQPDRGQTNHRGPLSLQPVTDRVTHDETAAMHLASRLANPTSTSPAASRHRDEKTTDSGINDDARNSSDRSVA